MPRYGDVVSTAILAILVLGATGCGKDGPEVVPVSGKVTFGGQAPPAEGMIYFTPLDGSSGGSMNPGSARFQKGDGSYEVTSMGTSEGLRPGEYNIRVECWKQPPVMGGPPGISHVGPTFQAPTLVVDAEKSSIEFDVDVPAG